MVEIHDHEVTAKPKCARETDSGVRSFEVRRGRELHRCEDVDRRVPVSSPHHAEDIEEGEQPQIRPDVHVRECGLRARKLDEADRLGRAIESESQIRDEDILVGVEPAQVESKRVGKIEPSLDGLATPDRENLVIVREHAVTLGVGEREVGIPLREDTQRHQQRQEADQDSVHLL